MEIVAEASRGRLIIVFVCAVLIASGVNKQESSLKLARVGSIRYEQKTCLSVCAVLIGSGVKKWEPSMEPAGVDSSSISSEAESVDDVWTITDEQREYYVKQFLTMQPDLAKHITGLF